MATLSIRFGRDNATGLERTWERSWSAGGYGVEILEPPYPQSADPQKPAKPLG